jgi:MtN3 and saliva related transmembrane protein
MGCRAVAFRAALWRCAHAMDTLTALGLTAATLTTCSFVPQLTKVWRTKSAADLSYGMFGAFSVGILLWFLYGLLRDDLPVIAANGITLVLSVTILALKIRYDR